MKRGYNELVGLQATFSRTISRYRLTHYYEWRSNGKTKGRGTVRGYDMRMHIPLDEIVRGLREAYAPAIISIWRQVTEGCVKEYYQFFVGCAPDEMNFPGKWIHWAER